MKNCSLPTLLVLTVSALIGAASAHAGHGTHQHHAAPEVDHEATLYSRASWDRRRRLDPANGDKPPKQPFCKVQMSDKEREIMGLVHAEYEANIRHNRELAVGDIEIPMYFHVIKPNASDYGKLDKVDAEFFEATLNFGFGGTGFTFKLVNTSETVSEQFYFCNDFRNPAMMKATRIRGPNALNVWFCAIEDEDVFGSASLPPQVVYAPNEDGVVMRNPSLKQSSTSGPAESELPNYFLSEWEERTFIFNGLTHEVGHWMGLAHTFENGCSNGTFPQYPHFFPEYFFVNDGIKDTAAHEVSDLTSETVYVCGNQKNPPTDTCPNDNPIVDPGVDPWDNYMNYLSGYCFENYGRFTSEQILRMQAQYNMFRHPDEKIRITTKVPTSAPQPTASPAPTADINYNRVAKKCMVLSYQNLCSKKRLTNNNGDLKRKFEKMIELCAFTYNVDPKKLASSAISKTSPTSNFCKNKNKNKKRRRRQKKLA